MSMASEIATKRLNTAQYAENFADLHPPLSAHEALVESDRCYFCYDAPCMKACPTSIDIPLFIREIQTGHPTSAAKTIFNQNIMGGMCARVCPTETLCEEACVREHAEGKPVKIGLLQRFATDVAMGEKHPFTRAAPTGKKVAVIGAGPAGLACAHRLAVYGHDVTIFEARKKSGGLNEFGIAAYKAVHDFAQKEVDFILSIGGITIKHNQALGKKVKLVELSKNYDAVFVGVGLTGANELGLKHEHAEGMVQAVDYISELRQAKDKSKLPVARNVVVIGGGMTAIDIAIQSKLLGAEHVTIVYRRAVEHMKASSFEQDLAQTKGVKIICAASPKKILLKGKKVAGLKCEYTTTKNNKLVGTGATFELAADMIFKAIGQNLRVQETDMPISIGGKFKVDVEKRTPIAGIWAGGDCAEGGQDLTVSAVDDGRRAAESIHHFLKG
jgi:dihydropyrimidine dehydrogenase (NAD+) subunit PreT